MKIPIKKKVNIIQLSSLSDTKAFAYRIDYDIQGACYACTELKVERNQIYLETVKQKYL